MSAAGPSRLPSDSQGRSAHAAGPSGTSTAEPSAKERKRRSAIEDIFKRQDLEEQQRLSEGFRQLQQEADDMKANIANITPADLTISFKKQDHLFRDVRDTAIATLDARLIISNADTAMGLARKMKIEGNAFDVDDFLMRMKSVLGLDRATMDEQSPASDEDELDENLEQAPRAPRAVRNGALGDWEKIGWMAASLLRRVPGVEFMYGPLAVEHRKRTVARRAARNELAPEVRPEEMQAQKGDSKKDHTLSNVRLVGKVLEKMDPSGQGVNLFRLAVNPGDYGQTVENFFFVSFLVKEGKAGVHVEDDGEIIIKTTEPNDVEMDGEMPSNQAVIELDVETWEEAKRIFNITESAIPQREYTDVGPMAANSWYT